MQLSARQLFLVMVFKCKFVDTMCIYLCICSQKCSIQEHFLTIVMQAISNIIYRLILYLNIYYLIQSK